MLQDAIWANTEKLSDPTYQDTTDEVHRRVAGGLGRTAATTPSRAATSCVKAGSKLGASHQLWQVNEVNKLIWPSPAAGVGTIDQAAWDRTVQVALQTKNADGATVLTKQPDAEAYTNEYVTQGAGRAEGRGRRRRGLGLHPGDGDAERRRRLSRSVRDRKATVTST